MAGKEENEVSTRRIDDVCRRRRSFRPASLPIKKQVASRKYCVVIRLSFTTPSASCEEVLVMRRMPVLRQARRRRRHHLLLRTTLTRGLAASKEV